MITIINYGLGNLKSIENALKYLGEKVKITEKPEEIKKAEKIILIGVGNFGEAIKNLKKKRLHSLIKEAISEGKPFLGICLGMQILFEESQESPGIKGLNILKGKVFKFKKVKTPQIGWNQIKIQRKTRILKGIKDKSFVYFMHSFYVKPLDRKIMVAVTNYGKDYCSAIELKNTFGVQFHPEKSGKIGLQILKNFIEL